MGKRMKAVIAETSEAMHRMSDSELAEIVGQHGLEVCATRADNILTILRSIENGDIHLPAYQEACAADGVPGPFRLVYAEGQTAPIGMSVRVARAQGLLRE